ncbi:DUF5123 domain-containing protein [Flavihumibacter sp. R14]|nr:DUF5123 domain-containing protein [Flavihumibacter soli]
MRLSVLCVLFLLLISACRKEEVITTDSSAKLQFSADTILFDTVFTSVGSTTRRLRVYNRNENAVRISEISLAGAGSSAFRININGQPVDKASRLELAGGDSLSIFIQVSINPGSAALPFIVADSILFSTNGNRQAVKLRAYGQNAHFLNEEVIRGNVTWDRQLPYVVYNSALVSKGAKLTIEKGARVYFHKGSKLLVAGTLDAQGDVNDSISFSGDRLEQIYSDEPGQWGGIHFLRESRNNIMQYSRIKNAVVGMRVDSLSNNADPKLILSSSIIKNMEVAGLLLYNAEVSGFNNLIYNCGQFLVYGAFGGRYNFKQNTFAGLNFSFPRQTPALYFSDHYSPGGEVQTAALQISLVNNIIWGSNDDELALDRKGNGTFSLVLQNNFIKSKDSSFGINGNILNVDPLFVDPRKGNFRLKVASPALNKGLDLRQDIHFIPYLGLDLEKNMRIFPSELGCYELN